MTGFSASPSGDFNERYGGINLIQNVGRGKTSSSISGDQMAAVTDFLSDNKEVIIAVVFIVAIAWIVVKGKK